MTAEYLSSNVVNYLVWRYLQEAGFGSAALHLSKEWLREPQGLPFANHVQKHTLIELLQDGLYFDQLQSATTGKERRFSFGVDHGRQFPVQRNGGSIPLPGADYNEIHSSTNGAVMDANSRKGPKRKKKSTGPGAINGDAMDIEPNGIHLPSRGESEAITSDVESPIIEEIPLPTTLSEGRNVDIQTDSVTELAPSTKIIKVEKMQSSLKHTLWNHFNGATELLFIAGQAIFQYYRVPVSLTAETESLPSRDVVIPMDDFEVTALCWAGPSTIAFAAREATKNELGETMSTYRLSMMEGEEYRCISSIVGCVFQMRWNQNTQLLLTISSTDIAGAIRIWRLDNANAISCHIPQPTLDAQWISDKRFVVSGQSFLKVFEVDVASEQITVVQEFTTASEWEQICYDPVCKLIACKTVNGDEIAIARVETGEIQTLSTGDALVTDIQFQPIPNPATFAENLPRLLATSSTGGIVTVWDAKRGFTQIYKVELEGRAAYALSFSPDGFLLAAAGVDIVLVWNAERGGMPKARWQGQPGAWVTVDDMDTDSGNQEQTHQLSWDAHGKKLAFTLGNELAIVNFQR